jgi:hypothetical protein
VLSILHLVFGLDLWSYGFVSKLRFSALSCYVSFLRFVLGSLIPCAGTLDFAAASYAGFGQVFSIAPPAILRVHEQRTVVHSPAECFSIRASGPGRHSCCLRAFLLRRPRRRRPHLASNSFFLLLSEFLPAKSSVPCWLCSLVRCPLSRSWCLVWVRF